MVKYPLGNDGSWLPICTAPFDRELELAVISPRGTHALAFPCRRILHGWLNAETDEAIDGVKPTHWREWPHREVGRSIELP